MEILLCFLAFEMIILVFFAPVTFIVKINLSLAREKAVVAVKVFGVMPIIFKAEKKKERFRISISGKAVGNKSHSEGKSKKRKNIGVSYISLLNDIASFIEKIDLFLMVGGQDAFGASFNYILATNILSILRAKIGTSMVLADYEKEVFVLDTEIKFRVSIIDILKMVDKYGNQRNFKTHNRQFKRSHQH